MKPAGVILAAGASRRMGRPKALLEFRGETFLDRLIGLFGSHCDPILVVVGEEAEAIAQGCRRAAEVRFVRNPKPERGQLSSLQCGLREVPEACPGVLFTPVDHPVIQAETVAALVGELRNSDAMVVVPTCAGRHGHPVLIHREVIRELLEAPEQATARDVLRRHGARTRYVEVADEAILRDIDDPGDYRRLVGAHTTG